MNQNNSCVSMNYCYVLVLKDLLGAQGSTCCCLIIIIYQEMLQKLGVLYVRMCVKSTFYSNEIKKGLSMCLVLIT